MAIATLGSMAEGSIIKLNEDGAPVEFYVAKQDYEPELNGTGRVLVVRKDCYDNRCWHSSNAYASSAIDSWLNSTYKNLLDANIRTAMGTTKIYYSYGNGSSAKGTLSRSAFLLSCAELGYGHDHMNVEGTELPRAVYELLRPAKLDGSRWSQWTRTPSTAADSPVWYLDHDSSLRLGLCTSLSGSRPAFTLPASLYMSGDGFISGGKPPNTPADITVPEEVLGGVSLALTWNASTDPDDDPIGYELERQVDGGEWTRIYKGADTSFTDTITRGWLTVSYRVRAYDSLGLYSDYITSPTREVNNNRAPSITCGTASGADLDVKSEGFTIPYSAADADGDPVTITEAIDGTVLRTFTPEADAPCAFSVTGETFMKLLNGAHTLTITASDGQAQAVHTLTFTKSVTAACVTLAQPMEADGPITLCVLSVTGSIPEGAAYSVKVTNNGRDAAPV